MSPPDPMTMPFGDFILWLLFLAQAGVGVLGNLFLFTIYAPTSCMGPAPRPTHLIFTNMSVANFLVLLVKWIPQVIFMWGKIILLDSTGCKLIYYVHRVGRGLSLCTTCLLSSFQAGTISPKAVAWMRLKEQASKNVRISCLLCWAFNLMANHLVLQNIESVQHSHNATQRKDYGICSYKTPVSTAIKGTIVLVFPDIIFLGLMAGASIYMLLVLRRHQRQVRYIHALRDTGRLSPEARATQTILLLAGAFILLYSANCAMSIYNTVMSKPPVWKQYTTSLLAATYPALSPLILMFRDPRTPPFCS
ncbi:vomeronasal type-1 receptor 4 [Dipodomys merriami]|uniref:vomeronasal type-1 receptor 4 n=1 Tax=Dipodomys merriami TaxID=94247 RepID=UPI00385607FB